MRVAAARPLPVSVWLTCVRSRGARRLLHWGQEPRGVKLRGAPQTVASCAPAAVAAVERGSLQGRVWLYVSPAQRLGLWGGVPAPPAAPAPSPTLSPSGGGGWRTVVATRPTQKSPSQIRPSWGLWGQARACELCLVCSGRCGFSSLRGPARPTPEAAGVRNGFRRVLSGVFSVYQ